MVGRRVLAVVSMSKLSSKLWAAKVRQRTSLERSLVNVSSVARSDAWFTPSDLNTGNTRLSIEDEITPELSERCMVLTKSRANDQNSSSPDPVSPQLEIRLP